MRKLLLLSLFLFSLFAHGQMTVETFTLKATGDKITFLKYLPSGYDKTKKYPVLVSLSGDGEKSTAGIVALQNSGINKLLISGTISLPFIVVSPQTPYANYDQIGPNSDMKPGVFATEMLDTAIARYNGDPTKTYISGLSMGGPSVPNALAYFPTRWAAGISMASWETDISQAPKIQGALWDIKVDNDGTAGAPDYNISFIQSCKNSKKAQYSVISGTCHCIWDQVYSDTWETMSISPNYTGSTKQSNIYTWLAQFSTTGTPAPAVIPVTVVPVVTNTVSYRSIPGKVEAEAYDNYYNVSTKPCSDTGATSDVGYVKDGSYMDYNVNVVTAGIYNVFFRIASTSAGTIQIRNAGGVPLDTFLVPVTGAWQKWKTISGRISLSSGNQTLRIYAAKSGWNLNWFDIEPLPLPSISITAPAQITVKNSSGAPVTVSGQTFTGDFIINVK